MEDTVLESEQSHKLDRCGAVASSVCAIHCAICALLPAIFAQLGLGFLEGHKAEWFFTILAIGLAAMAFLSFWKRHKSNLVAFFFIAGIVGLLSSRMLEAGSGHHDHHGHEEHELHEEKHGHDSQGTTAHKDKSGDQDHDGNHSDSGHKSQEDLPKKDTGIESEAHSDDFLHMAGSLVGVIGGLFLLLGHILNIRALRSLNK